MSFIDRDREREGERDFIKLHKRHDVTLTRFNAKYGSLPEKANASQTGHLVKKQGKRDRPTLSCNSSSNDISIVHVYA